MGRALVLGALAGASVAIAGAPTEAFALEWFTGAWLLGALEPDEGRPASGRHALIAGAAMGVTAQVWSCYWIVEVLERFAHLPVVAAAPLGSLLWIAQATPYVLGAGIARAVMRAGAPGWLAVPGALTLTSTLCPAIFPWRLGLGQLPWLEYAQVAELGGLPLLDWLVLTGGAAGLATARGLSRWWGASARGAVQRSGAPGIADARPSGSWRSAAPAALCAAAVALPALYGALRLPSVLEARARAPRLRVGVVQPNTPIAEKNDLTQHMRLLSELRAASAALEAQGAELVAWPETAYSFPIRRTIARDRPGPRGLLRDGVRGPLIVGVVSLGVRPVDAPREDEATSAAQRPLRRVEIDRFNSALAVDEGGAVVGLADKVHLLAFGEYTPMWDTLPWLQVFSRGLSPGTRPPLLTVAGARIGVLNCYEDLLADFVASQARRDSAFLLNLTNDAWFGDTTAPLLHHMNARVRAIETRRELVRAVNTGVSGHTSATGEDLVRTETFVAASFIADVALLDGETPYVALGDWVSPIAGAYLSAWVLVSIRRRRRRDGRSMTRPA